MSKGVKIVSNAMSGASVEESSKNVSKIISNVAKQIVIDKMAYTADTGN